MKQGAQRHNPRGQRESYFKTAGLASFIVPSPSKNLCQANQLVIAFGLGVRLGMLLAEQLSGHDK